MIGVIGIRKNANQMILYIDLNILKYLLMCMHYITLMFAWNRSFK